MSETSETGHPRIAYEVPEFRCHNLQIVILGGPSGEGDSGSPNTEQPDGLFSGEWEDNDDDDWGNRG